MKQKTLKFIWNDNIDAFMEHEDFKVGDEVVLVEVSPEVGGCGYFYLQREPVAGNSNPNISRYHGWRGTTNGMAKYAHGLRKIKSVNRSGEFPNEVLKIVVGDDLHPEWD